MNDTVEQSSVAVLPEPGTAGPGAPAEEELVEVDELVEEVSIDGMCGVY